MSQFRTRFETENGTTRCGGILEKLGEQDDMDKCTRMTASAAAILAGLLEA